MKAHHFLGSTRPVQGRCTFVRAFTVPSASAGGNVMFMYRGRCTNPSKRFGWLAHIEDPTTPGEGDA